MRIAFVYPASFAQPSANRFSALKNCEALVELGHAVDLLIPFREWSPDQVLSNLRDAAFDFGIRVLPRVKPLRFVGIRAHGYRLFSLVAALFARRHRYDLCWCRDVYAAAYSARLGIPSLLEWHTPLSERGMRTAQRAASLRTFRGWVCISDAHRRVERALGFREDKLFVAHSGVDLRSFEDARARGPVYSLPRPAVLYCGSLYGGRGHDTFLEAAQMLPAATFVIAGDPKEGETRLRERCASRGIKNVLFTGRIPARDVPSLLLEADILAAPYGPNAQSISGEVTGPVCSPVKVFEYMAAGRPIVATAVGGIPEVLRHEGNALLVPPDNAHALAAAIQELLGRPERGRRLAQRAREDVSAYTWELRVAAILEFAARETESSDEGHAG